MATREHQGLQIALIVFLILTVALAISTYVFYRQAEENFGLAQAARTEATNKTAQYDSKNYVATALQYVMGGYPTATREAVDALKGRAAPTEIAEVDKILADHATHMAAFAASATEDDRKYKNLQKLLTDALASRNQEVTKLSASVAQLETAKANADTDAATKVAAAEQGLAAAKTDVETSKQAYVAANAESLKKFTDLEATLNNKNTEYNTKTAALEAQVATLTGDKTKAETDARSRAARIQQLTSEEFERPHGQIKSVDQRGHTVYINLGRAHGLQRGVTFSVYDKKVDTLSLPDPTSTDTTAADQVRKLRKASIEVTQVLSDDVSEARILDDKLAEPIMSQDNIFTPAWRPGERMKFALVGRMDLDDDGNSDREKVRSMILSNGAEIVYEMLDNGTFVGSTQNIDANTQFLVTGKRPDEVANQNVQKQYQDALTAAKDSSVRQINVKDLVEYMGWKGADRTVKLGGGAARVIDRSAPNSDFRPRTPPGTGPAVPATNGAQPPVANPPMTNGAAQPMAPAAPMPPPAGGVRPMPPVDNSDPFGP